MKKRQVNFRIYLAISVALGAFIVPSGWEKYSERQSGHGEQLPSVPDKLHFSSRELPWAAVLKQLAQDADLHFESNSIPSGTIRFPDPTRQYSPDEAVDRINELWLEDGYTLVRSGRLLWVVDMSRPPRKAPNVPLSQLDVHDDLMLATVVLKPVSVTADIQAGIEQWLGPEEDYWISPGAKQMVVRATIGKIKLIRDKLREPLPNQ